MQPISEIRAAVKKNAPLIHCITNPISINQCANTVLSAGARPMMAEHPEEAAVMTSGAGAVMLNMGNLTDVRKLSMLMAYRFCWTPAVQPACRQEGSMRLTLSALPCRRS